MDPIDQTVQDSAAKGSWAAIAALVVWAVIALAKSDKTPPWMTPPVAWRPLIAVLLGQVYAVLEAGVHGMPWGSAVVRGFVVAAAAIAGQELKSKLTSPPAPAAPKGSGDSASSSDDVPPVAKRVALGAYRIVAPAHRGPDALTAAYLAAIVTALGVLPGCSAFTPAQNATIAAEVPKIANAGCTIAQGFTDNKFVKFLCKVVESGGDGVLSNMSTGPGSVSRSPKTMEVEVLVPKEQADAFAKENAGQ